MIEQYKSSWEYDCSSTPEAWTHNCYMLVNFVEGLKLKINELVDAVNELKKDYDNVCVWVGEQKLKTRAETVQQVSYTAPGDITVFHGFNCSVEFDIPLPKGTRITIKSITKGGDSE